jgi:hypothetical protein
MTTLIFPASSRVATLVLFRPRNDWWGRYLGVWQGTGAGWAAGGSPLHLRDLQRFVNVQAAAIRRADPQVGVLGLPAISNEGPGPSGWCTEGTGSAVLPV